MAIIRLLTRVPMFEKKKEHFIGFKHLTQEIEIPNEVLFTTIGNIRLVYKVFGMSTFQDTDSLELKARLHLVATFAQTDNSGHTIISENYKTYAIPLPPHVFDGLTYTLPEVLGSEIVSVDDTPMKEK